MSSSVRSLYVSFYEVENNLAGKKALEDDVQEFVTMYSVAFLGLEV